MGLSKVILMPGLKIPAKLNFLDAFPYLLQLRMQRIGLNQIYARLLGFHDRKKFINPVCGRDEVQDLFQREVLDTSKHPYTVTDHLAGTKKAWDHLIGNLFTVYDSVELMIEGEEGHIVEAKQRFNELARKLSIVETLFFHFPEAIPKM